MWVVARVLRVLLSIVGVSFRENQSIVKYRFGVDGRCCEAGPEMILLILLILLRLHLRCGTGFAAS